MTLRPRRRTPLAAAAFGAAVALAVATHAVAAPTPARAAVAPATAAPTPAADVYTIDVNHSELQFRIRHLVSRVNGTFNTWKGTITVPDESRWETAQIEVVIQAASIDTKNERRDNHLRTSDFFEPEVHPTITFRSTRIERAGDAARIHGTLTMRGVTKPVVLEGELLGAQRTAQGKNRIGFEARTMIDRTDYGVAWNRAAEGGGVTLGDEVEIMMTVAAVQQ